MVAELDGSRVKIKQQVHAKISVTLALLRAFKLAELVALVNNVLAVFAVVYSPALQMKIIAGVVLILGLSVFYFAVRMRIDVSLFECWDGLDISALDEALANLKDKHQSGRSIDARLQGSNHLFKRGILLLFVQCSLLVIAVSLL